MEVVESALHSMATVADQPSLSSLIDYQSWLLDTIQSYEDDYRTFSKAEAATILRVLGRMVPTASAGVLEAHHQLVVTVLTAKAKEIARDYTLLAKTRLLDLGISPESLGQIQASGSVSASQDTQVRGELLKCVESFKASSKVQL